MSVYVFTELHDSAGAVDAAARHLRIWLTAAGTSYDATARELFVRAHPMLFGRAGDVTLRGYDRWRWRRRLHDTAASFSRYIAPRHQRWLVAEAGNSTMAPCLVGKGKSLPCWTVSRSKTSGAQGEVKSAA